MQSMENLKIIKCHNCNSTLQEGAFYCQSCGQKITDGKISLADLIKNFFDSVFNLNSKSFKTIIYLFIPGKLTEEYFKGKHKSYSNPVRIFLVSLLLFMAFFSIKYKNSNLKNIKFNDNSIEKMFVTKKYNQKFDTSMLIIKKKFNSPIVDNALDSLHSVYYRDKNDYIPDSINIGQYTLFSKDSLLVSITDIKNMTATELIKKYDIKSSSFIQKLFFKQVLKTAITSNSKKEFLLYLAGKFSWLMFFLIPITAFLLKLFYIRHNYYYVEHLVFNFHFHSFLLIIFALILSINAIFPDWLITILVIFFVLYFPFALRKYYKQSWGKTILKTFLFGFLYTVSFVFVFIFFLLFGLALF